MCLACCDPVDPLSLLRGLFAGLVATGPMLIVEIPLWRRFGLRGVFEWHEIHESLARRTGRQVESLGTLDIALHFAAGGLAGVLFALAVSVGILTVPLPLQGLVLGLMMWLLTLLIHGSITGVRPFRNDMGLGPATGSLVGHLVFGSVLGFLVGLP